MAKQKEYAFWRYDLCPYVLGGEVVRRNRDGTVEVKGYGRGFWFLPFKIIRGQAGEEAVKEISRLQGQYRQQERWMKDLCVERTCSVLNVSYEKLMGHPRAER